MGIAKAATASVNAVGFPGQFETTITMTIENFGDVEIRNLQVTDDLATIFTGGATVEAISGLSATGGLTVNASFDGDTDTNLLAGTDTLAVGDTAEIEFTVRFDPNGETGPFDNIAIASGESPSEDPITDDSTDGTDPDADVSDDTTDGTDDNDGRPYEDDPTPISFTEEPLIGVAKAATITDYGNTDPGIWTSWSV